MWDVTRRLLTFSVFAALFAYVVFLAAGATIYAQEEERARTVWIRDEISPNIHRLAGMVTVPSTCSELSVRIIQLSTSLFKLEFKTWEHPYVECLHEKTRVAFHEVVFAPAVGITFIATMDDKPLPILVTPSLPQ